jgi:flagellar hook-basal body complex protein FliE
MVDRITSPALVANAYNAGQKAAETTGLAAEGGGINFADLIKSGITNAVTTIRGGEAASARAVTGTADLNDVVQAVTRAELTLQTIVAIRDRLVSSYQDILRMPI